MLRECADYRNQRVEGSRNKVAVSIGLVMCLAGANLYGADSLNCRLVGGWFSGPCYTVFTKDTVAFMGDACYLRILNVKNPASPVEIGFCATALHPKDVYVVDTLAYVANAADGLRIMNVANPASPVEIGFCDTDDFAQDVYVADTLAYVADNSDGLRIINVADPEVPVEVGFYETGDCAYGVYVVDTLAYVAYGTDGLRIVNVANPASPVEIGFHDTGDLAFSVYVVDTLAYVTDYDAGLRIVNVANPVSPVEVGFYDTDGSARDIYVADTLAYVADGNGLRIIEYYGGQGTEEQRSQVTGCKSPQLEVHPNPSSGNVVIKYGLPEKASISLKLHDISGRPVKTLVNGEQEAGSHSVSFSARGGSRGYTKDLTPGIYFAKLSVFDETAGNYESTKKLILVR